MAEFSQSNIDSRTESRLFGGRENMSDDEDESMDLRFIVVGRKSRQNKELGKALEALSSPVLHSDTGFEHMNDAKYDTVFVVDNFAGDIFHRLHVAKCRIVGPPVVIQCVDKNECMPCNTRPLYCQLMQGLVLCFTGFKVKEDLSRLAELVHHMGGSIRKEYSARVTHLVANCTTGEKYRVGVSMGRPIMTEAWVHYTWDNRDSFANSADEETLTQFKLSPFSFSILSFVGFTREEQRHMEEVTVENGGSIAEAGAPSCTHLVVDEHVVKQISFETHHKLHIVKAEWFWASIQMDACADESMYNWADITEQGTPGTPRSNKSTPGKPLSGNKSRKRKRLRENLAQLAHEGEVDTPMYKRRSSEMGRMSFSSASFLDATVDTSSGTPLSEHGLRGNGVTSPCPVPLAQIKEPVKMSARHHTVLELFQTEKNYVGILHTILKAFKEEIERVDQPGGPLLDSQETKTIFGGIPPIYYVHVKIRDELNELSTNWHDNKCVGDVVLKHADALNKAYPNFVNYFDKAKEAIAHCDRCKPRFHAFLKVCQTKPECGRQSLPELLIRPVQRLPSVMLLLKEILKRTEETHADHSKLGQAIATLEGVMKDINEDRRKAEGHQTMFEIVNDIENCPPNLLSAHRSFVQKVDAYEVTDQLSGKGDAVSLFIFSDSLEMCKRRTKVLYSRSPGIAAGPKTPQKAYKHLDVMQFSCIKRVVNIMEGTECRSVFALVTKKLEEKEERLYCFTLADDGISKEDFLTMLCKTISSNMCRADYETLLATVEACTLHIDTSDLGGNNTLTRAASRFGKRVSRAFSFNKTPRKLKRALSSMTQMMSPARRDSGVYRNMHTPHGADNLRAMRLASTNDLTDESIYENTYSELVDQMSIQGTPTPQRRRDTLIGLNFCHIQDEVNRSKFKSIRKQFSRRLTHVFPSTSSLVESLKGRPRPHNITPTICPLHEMSPEDSSVQSAVIPSKTTAEENTPTAHIDKADQQIQHTPVPMEH